MTHVLSMPIAFVAGIISFLSPCVLPLVPGYVSMLSGASIEELRVEASGQLLAQVLRNSLAFVAGFTVVFVVLGASATWVGRFLLVERTWFNIVAGAIIVIFGLHLTGLLNIPLLYREARLDTGAPRRGLGGAFLLDLHLHSDGLLHRSDPGRDFGARGPAGDGVPGDVSAGHLFRRTRCPLPPHKRWPQRFSQMLRWVPQALAGGGGCLRHAPNRAGRSDGLQ